MSYASYLVICLYFLYIFCHLFPSQRSQLKISHANPINTSASPAECQNKLSETFSDLPPPPPPPTHKRTHNKQQQNAKANTYSKMKLACNIRWRLRLELQHNGPLPSPNKKKTNVELNVRILFAEEQASKRAGERG